jgi:hypothetical protein
VKAVLSALPLSLILVVGILAPTVVESQASPRRLSGTVRDSAGRLLENAVIALNPNEAVRSTRADAQGRFAFNGVAAGQYDLRVTWVGYVPVDRTITVPPEGLDVEIVLARLAFQLDTMRVVARQTGIFGTAVQRSDFRALGGADVQVLGTRFRTKTKGDGLFGFPDLREGSYIVLGRRDGFESRLLPVPVPSNEAVEIALALDSAATKGQQIANNRIQDMQMRRNRASAINSALVGRHELAASKSMSLDVALRYAPSFLYKALIWEGVECIYVDGIPQPNMRAKDFQADQVEMVEVYTGGEGGNGRDFDLFRKYGTECGVGPTVEAFGDFRNYRRSKPGTIGVVHIWLKK